MNTNRCAEEALPVKAAEPFFTRVMSIILQLVQYLLRLFFGDQVVVTDT